MLGHIYTLLLVPQAVVQPPAASNGAVFITRRGEKTLAEFEAEWRALDKKLAETPEAKRSVKRKRRQIRKEAAEVIYGGTSAEVQEYAARLKAEQDSAKLAEMRALNDLLDLKAETDWLRILIARTAVTMARQRAEEARKALEEFDVIYVAAMLAEA